MAKTWPILVTILRDPRVAVRLTPQQWDLLLRQARRADLLAHLHVVFDRAGSLSSAPTGARQHLDSARNLAAKQVSSVRWEIHCIVEAMATAAMVPVLLKGAAYVALDLPVARGRLFGDVDVLVPREAIEQTERALLLHGWLSSDMDSYDERYYRRWMHEIPPMRHVKRGTVMDLHHNILPDTARLKPDASKLLAAACAVTTMDGVRVLAPIDMFLHSATHLFHEGEFPHGLRDLVDLDGLLVYLSTTEPGFWAQLVARAAELDLMRPLFYALRYCSQILQSPIPASVWPLLVATEPSVPLLRMMDALFHRALLPEHASCEDSLTPTARTALYVRSHYLKMPLGLLLPHLLRKAYRRRVPDDPVAEKVRP